MEFENEAKEEYENMKKNLNHKKEEQTEDKKEEQKEDTEEIKAEVIPSILNDMAAHTVRIPADEGAQIYIKELRKSYIAAGGYAEFTVADYIWYELESNIENETMEVSLTPYIKTSAGELRKRNDRSNSRTKNGE